MIGVLTYQGILTQLTQFLEDEGMFKMLLHHFNDDRSYGSNRENNFW